MVKSRPARTPADSELLRRFMHQAVEHFVHLRSGRSLFVILMVFLQPLW